MVTKLLQVSVLHHIYENQGINIKNQTHVVCYTIERLYFTTFRFPP